MEMRKYFIYNFACNFIYIYIYIYMLYYKYIPLENFPISYISSCQCHCTFIKYLN